MDLVHSSRETEQMKITIASNTTKATVMMCVPTKKLKIENLHFTDNIVVKRILKSIADVSASS